MGELIQNLGIDARLLLAQVLNFFILFFILRKFLYRPLLTKLDERRARAEGNIEKEKQLSAKIESAEAEHERVLGEARARSNEIIEEARKRAIELEESIVAEAHDKAARLIESAERGLEDRKKQFDKELMSQAGDLITRGIEKALPRVLDERTHQKLVEESLKEFSALSTRP